MGRVEKGNVNPGEEFLASYFASKAVLPREPVIENYYYRRSVSPVNMIIYYAQQPSILINKYMDKIKDLLMGVDKSHQIETIELIKKTTGITIKL